MIELMIVVAILGILAAIAIPALLTYSRKARASEATVILANLFKATATHYSRVQPTVASPRGITMQAETSCIVPSTAGLDPAAPSNLKQVFQGTDPAWVALDFNIAEYVFFGFGIVSKAGAPPGICYGNGAGQPDLYTLSAYGDLDGDATFSTFELAVGSNAENVLYHARGFYIVSPIE